jgi:hypothetical protein
MKIPESIIEKYYLVPSDEQCGASFMNNLVVYKSTIIHLDGFRFMECDMKGIPSDYITVLKTNGDRSISVEFTKEMLEDVPVLTGIEIIYKQLGSPPIAAFRTY